MYISIIYLFCKILWEIELVISKMALDMNHDIEIVHYPQITKHKSYTKVVFVVIPSFCVQYF